MTRQKKFCKKCGMIFDHLAISNKSWTFEANPRWSENCVFGPPEEPILSKILKNYFFMISFISFNNVITFLKHLGKMTLLTLYLKWDKMPIMGYFYVIRMDVLMNIHMEICMPYCSLTFVNYAVWDYQRT